MQNARNIERDIFRDRAAQAAEGQLGAPTVMIPVRQDGTTDPEALKQLEECRSKAVRVLDLLDMVLMEVMLVEHPEYKLERDRLESRFVEFRRAYLGAKDSSLAGSWVYYPNGTLLHLLSPDDHYRLRTSRNIGLFTPDEQARFRRARIAVAGLSVGGLCATTLAMEGVNNFYLTDFDKLACSNLNRLGSSLSMLGVEKTRIIAQKIWDIDPFAEIRTNDQGFCPATEQEIFGGDIKPDVFIDAMDSIEAKIASRAACRKHRVPVVWMMDIGDGIVQIGCERYDLDPSYPAFHGRRESVEKRLGRPLNYVESILSIIDLDYMPHRLAESFYLACNCKWPGVSQLAGTVSVAAGAMARTVRRVLMGEPVVNEYFMDVDEKADPDHATNRARDRAKTAAFMKQLGIGD